MDPIGISIIETDGQIFVRGQAHEGRPAVDAAALQAMLVQLGFGACAQDGEAPAQAVDYCNTRTDPFVVQVAERRDAHIEIHVASDAMVATLSIRPPQGGKPASMDDVVQALTHSGVVHGIDDTAILQACEHGQCSHTPVAHGTLPQDGEDSVFEELLPQTTDRAPKVDANGLIDYREHGAITLVTAGMPLMQRHPAQPGVNGHTVRGASLPARNGRDEPYAIPLAGAQTDSANPNLLKAEVSGLPVRVKYGVVVEPVLEVAEVNMASGNIRFDGTVHIKGDVVQGMNIQASGDIVVGGMVDGGILEAGGSITVTGGVISLAKLRAAGAVSARFAQGVHIHAGTVISLADMALDCELQSLNQVVIGAQAPGKGRLVGGTTTAMMLVRVPLLGSAKGAATKLVLGVNPELSDKYEALLERIQQEKETEENLDKLMKQVTAAGDPKGMLPRIKASRQNAVQVWGKSLSEKDELEQQMARTAGARVDVGTAVSGAVDISFGNHTARLRRDFATGIFTLDPAENTIVFTNGLGQSAPAL